MKFNLYVIILLITFYSCNKNNTEDLAPVEVILTDNVEVYNADLISNDYVMAVEHSSTTSYLLNKKGEKIYNWDFSQVSGNDIELLSDGSIIGIFRQENPSIDFGGAGGIAKIIDKENVTVWEYTVSDNNSIAHHDVEILPNGNVLMIVWERVLNQIAIENGAALEFENDIFTEKIIEIDRSSNSIVWEWNSWDHIVQDKFEDLNNYGNINENPNKININYSIDNPPGGNFFIRGDIMHANGIDYDENKDVIYLSVNYFNEVWVIDHSTTTSEAESSIGGNYNKGGDLIYRFGNPETYNSLGDKIFDKNHFPNLLKTGVPGAGNILIYSNNGPDGLQQSTVYEMMIPEPFSLLPNVNNEPTKVWSFTDQNLHFGKISGADRLVNGNTLICEGDFGIWEVTPNGDIVWKYESEGVSWRAYGYELESTALKYLGL